VRIVLTYPGRVKRGIQHDDRITVLPGRCATMHPFDRDPPAFVETPFGERSGRRHAGGRQERQPAPLPAKTPPRAATEECLHGDVPSIQTAAQD